MKDEPSRWAPLQRDVAVKALTCFAPCNKIEFVRDARWCEEPLQSGWPIPKSK